MQINRINASSTQATLNKKQNLNFGSSSTLASMSSNFVDKAGDAVDKIPKRILNALQFKGINMSFPFLVLTTYCFVLLPRLITASKRDKDEVKDILRRDVVTITAICFAVPFLNKLVARACQKKTGLLLSTNPAKKTQGLLKNAFDVLRPEKGDRILNSFDAKHFYSNIGDYKGGEKGFFGVLAENGADLGKMLKNMKKDQPVLEAMYKEAGKQGSIFSASNKDVLDALGKAFDSNSGDLKKGADVIKKTFADPNNIFVNLTKFYNSLTGAANIFAVSPLFLGVFLPKMNEKKTQEIVAKRLAEKEQAQQAQQKQPETTSFRSILNNRQQTSETFKKFLG